MADLKFNALICFVLDEKQVPWFPRSAEDLDFIANVF